MEGSIASKTTFVNASGRNLRRLLYGKPLAERAKVAAILTTEQWHVTRLLPAQAARLCQVHPGYVTQKLNGRRTRRTVTDREVDRVVAEIGYERIMQSLDRATRPTAVAAE